MVVKESPNPSDLLKSLTTKTDFPDNVPDNGDI